MTYTNDSGTKSLRIKKAKLSMLLSGSAGGLFYFPIMLADNKGSLVLIARQWVWAEHMAKGRYKFQVMVIFDESLLPIIFEADDAEIQRLTDDMAADNSRRNTTRDREKCRATGRICPVCGGVLRQPRSKKDRVINGEQHIISCENNVKDKTSKHYDTKCNFVMSLTDAEIIKFKKYELNINDILEKSDEVCKKCPSKLYKRTITLTSQVTDATSFPGNGDHLFYNTTSV